MVSDRDRRDRLREHVGAILDLPEDLVLNLPRLVLIGNVRIVVENHRGLVLYQPERIVVAVEDGRVEIAGESLDVARVDAEEIAIRGTVTAIRFDP